MFKPAQHLLRHFQGVITKAAPPRIVSRTTAAASSSSLSPQLLSGGPACCCLRFFRTSSAAKIDDFIVNQTFHKQQQQCRNMVTITQTKAGETTTTPQVEVTNTSSSSTTPNSNNQDIIITPACINRIKQLSKSRNEPSSLYLRLYVDAGGCSGFQYKFNLESNDPSSPSYNIEDGGIDPDDDLVFTQDGEQVVIDKSSLEYLRGSTIDYVQEMIKSSFEVRDNPNSENACGCGSSFAVKKFELNPALD